MQLRLTYEGELLSGGKENKKRRAHKHDIRKKLHSQIRAFWSIHPHLSYQLTHDINGRPVELPNEAIVENIAGRFRRQNGFRFVPLVREKSLLMCSLEILYLRQQKPGSIVFESDIDNRLKTLFDALKVPNDGLEFPDVCPSEDEDPFFCLLEDDKLITRVAVEADYLLAPTSEAPKENDARVVITVRIQPYVQTLGIVDANSGYA